MATRYLSPDKTGTAASGCAAAPGSKPTSRAAFAAQLQLGRLLRLRSPELEQLLPKALLQPDTDSKFSFKYLVDLKVGHCVETTASGHLCMLCVASNQLS